jgi:hypothetical protein
LVPVKEGRPSKGAEEPVDGEEQAKWAVDAPYRQLATAGLQLLLRPLDRGGAHHVAEGHAAEIELDVMMIGGRAMNRAAE